MITRKGWSARIGIWYALQRPDCRLLWASRECATAWASACPGSVRRQALRLPALMPVVLWPDAHMDGAGAQAGPGGQPYAGGGFGAPQQGSFGAAPGGFGQPSPTGFGGSQF